MNLRRAACAALVSVFAAVPKPVRAAAPPADPAAETALVENWLMDLGPSLSSPASGGAEKVRSGRKVPPAAAKAADERDEADFLALGRFVHSPAALPAAIRPVPAAASPAGAAAPVTEASGLSFKATIRAQKRMAAVSAQNPE